MTIKETLASLPCEDRRRLMYAFENEFSQYVQTGNQFIGVNVDHIKHLVIEQKAGVWSIGKIKGE